MASGIKGTQKPSGGTPTLASTPIVTATATTTLILSCCNQAAAAETLKIAVVPASETGTGAIPAQYYVEFDFSLGANTAMERTGLTLESGAKVFVGSASGNISFVAYGLES